MDEFDAWRARFLTSCGQPLLDEALAFIAAPDFGVVVHYSYDLGMPTWAIGVRANTDFWLDTCATRLDALALCKACGWRIAGTGGGRHG